VKRATVLAAALLTIGGVVGCKENKKTSDLRTNGSVTDITAPAPTASAYQPAPQPVFTQPAAQPVMYDTTPMAANNGGNYTVRKGDTLYSIARQRYGDGKQWTRIASANPGVKPETLKVGQMIVIP
jgi:5'-nucleotidase / UDP-sugar diphosphatase